MEIKISKTARQKDRLQICAKYPGISNDDTQTTPTQLKKLTNQN